jgi:cytochrome c oxidase subunit 2
MFPEPSYYARDVDFVMLFIVVASIILFLATSGTMVYFVFKYHRKKNPEPTQVSEKLWIEITWTVIPILLVLYMFYLGSSVFLDSRMFSKDAMIVKVLGRQWAWAFTYPNGKTADTMYLPINQEVKFEMTTADVNHSFYLPAFRLKMDILSGGRYYMVIKPDKPGEYTILCAEYCGLLHSHMTTVLRVVSREDFEKWLNEKPGEKPEIQTTNPQKPEKDSVKALAMKVLEDKGCLLCHSTDGSKMLGPSFALLSKGESKVMTDGQLRSIKIDDNYLKKSIIDPNADIVEGYFKDTMPSFRDKLKRNEIREIVKSLNEIKGKNKLSEQ